MQVSMYYNCNASNMLGRELTDVRPPANFVKMFAHLHKQTRNFISGFVLIFQSCFLYYSVQQH